MKAAELLRPLTQSLEQSKISYMLTGSFASNVYGMGRGSQDFDFVISATPEQIEILSTLLAPPDYTFDLNAALEALRHNSTSHVFDMVRGWKIDFICQKPSAFHRDALRRRTKADLEGGPVFITTAEDLIVAKLGWANAGASSRHIEDVADILKVRGESLDKAHIENWVRNLELTTQWAHARKVAGLEN
jgi:hypothetical protein